MKLTFFSRHAFLRLNQRTRLSCEDIALILDKGLVVNTGQKPGIPKRHLLFYSQADDDFFVAIQDELDGMIVTILPLDYHKNLAWKVSEEECNRARDLIIYAPKLREEKSSTPNLKPTIFAIYGHYFEDDGLRKSKLILKTGSDPYGNDMKSFLNDETLFAEIKNFAHAKGINPEKLIRISVRLGNHGEPVYIDFQ